MPQREEVAFAAFAPLPREFGGKDRQRLAVAVRVMSDGSQEYSRRAVLSLTQGESVRASLLPDGVLVRFEVPKGNLTNGISLMEGLLRRPNLTQERLDETLGRFAAREPSAWGAALRQDRVDLKTVKLDDARALLARVFDPRRVVVAVVGGFASGEARSKWETRTADWRPAVEPRYPDISPSPEPRDSGSGLTTVELRGQPFPATEPSLPARWLAMLALGVGKGGALFRDVRQVEGWSYRQEAILWPDPAGLEPRLLAASISAEGEATRAEELRATLLKAISGWTEDDRLRALGAAGLNLGPLWLVNEPVGTGLLDRAALEAYWWAKAGASWDPDALRERMRAVPLEALKAEATAIVTGARAVVLPGRAR